MKCDEFLAVLHDYVDGEVDNKTEKQIKEHLSGCQSCLRAYKEMEALKKAVAASGDVPVPEGMAEAAIAAIQNEIESAKVGFQLPAFLKSWALYVTVAACFALFFVLKDSKARQLQSYSYDAETGTVVATDNAPAKARAVTEIAEPVSPYTTVSSLVKHRITFKVQDAAAKTVFQNASSAGTDAVIRALTDKGFAFTIEYSTVKDCTAEYNQLVNEASAIFINAAKEGTEASSALSPLESQMQALKKDCSVPELLVTE